MTVGGGVRSPKITAPHVLGSPPSDGIERVSAMHSSGSPAEGLRLATPRRSSVPRQRDAEALPGAERGEDRGGGAGEVGSPDDHPCGLRGGACSLTLTN